MTFVLKACHTPDRGIRAAPVQQSSEEASLTLRADTDAREDGWAAWRLGGRQAPQAGRPTMQSTGGGVCRPHKAHPSW